MKMLIPSLLTVVLLITLQSFTEGHSPVRRAHFQCIRACNEEHYQIEGSCWSLVVPTCQDRHDRRTHFFHWSNCIHTLSDECHDSFQECVRQCDVDNNTEGEEEHEHRKRR